MINSFIIFIVPSLGRTSLFNSIKSLINQSDKDWRAIIILDGVKKDNKYQNIDERINIIEIDKSSSAGIVRNKGLDYLSKSSYESEWIGFLDDDDIISNDYIIKLKKEIEFNSKIDVCLFRMAYPNGCILPNRDLKNIKIGRVGISFAIRRNIYISDKIRFNNCLCEDYFFLKDLENKKYKIVISSYVTYFIKNENTFNCNLYPKVLINYN
jgi:hypothetical protein